MLNIKMIGFNIYFYNKRVPLSPANTISLRIWSARGLNKNCSYVDKRCKLFIKAYILKIS